jgi:hypothetical protein
MTITLNLPPEVVRRLQEKAAFFGQTVETFLEEVAQRQSGGETAGATYPQLANEEFDRLLDELAEGRPLPHLPADLSRADMYTGHD